MTTTVYTNNDLIANQNLEQIAKLLGILDLQRNSKSQIIDAPLNYRKGIIYKAGRLTKRTTSYLKTSQSKSSVLIATWAIESIAYALTFILLISSGSIITAVLWSALYAYITYAFFTLLKDAMVFNYAFKTV